MARAIREAGPVLPDSLWQRLQDAIKEEHEAHKLTSKALRRDKRVRWDNVATEIEGCMKGGGKLAKLTRERSWRLVSWEDPGTSPLTSREILRPRTSKSCRSGLAFWNEREA
jgi:hypothetical protein